MSAGAAPVTTGTVVEPSGIADGAGPRRRDVASAMRWAQLTLAETDPAPGSDFDIDFWFDYLRRCHVDGLCVSAGGYVAYYPTAIDVHHRSRWLGGRDVLGELVRRARSAGMAVLARVDPHVVRQDVAERHPAWLARDPEGRARRHPVSPDLYLTCPFSEYSTVVVPQIMEEIVTEYDVDGIFANRWTGHGVSYSEAAREGFRRATGRRLPLEGDGRARWRQYSLWRRDALHDLAETWDAGLRAASSAARFYPNSGGGPLSDLDMERLTSDLPGFFMDRQAREGATPLWRNGHHAKEFRAALGDRALGAIFSIGFEAPYRWKDSVQSAAELRLWVAEAIAHGARPWFTKFGGAVRDRRWLETVEELYSWHAEVEPYLVQATSAARVALVTSVRTQHQVAEGQEHERAQSPSLGWAQVLIEARIPFDIVHADHLDQAVLDRYRCLVMPNVPVLQDATAHRLRAWVLGGGALVATQEAASLNLPEEGISGGVLDGILGIERVGRFTDAVRNSYLALASGDPVRSRIEGTDRIINGVRWQPVDVRDDEGERRTRVVARLLPPFPDLPMEDMYPRDETPGEPQVLASEVGAGRTVYFAGDVDRIVDEVRNPDLGDLLRGSVEWATRSGHSAVITEAPGLLDVSHWEHPGGSTVRIVNLTGPDAMRGPVREILRHPGAVVTVECGRRPCGVRLLRAGVEAEWTWAEGEVRIDLPGIDDLEIIAIDMAGDGG